MSTDSTRQRILEAAGETFAQVGFKAATIRQIVDRAGANLSAVNYHFRDKETLYREVLEYLTRNSVERYPVDGGLPPDSPAEVRLRAFVTNFVKRMNDAHEPAWKGELMTREMTEPSPVFDTVVKQVFMPVRNFLARLVAELIDQPQDTEDVHLAVNGIIAQCVFYKHFEKMSQRFGMPMFSSFEHLTDHITRFSLQGLAGFRKETP